ncbi:MAG: DNA cytosine methyltransferase [Verrucomicrobiales bacterium]|nr:DNA cytosine methyltransferase [Verrucomicrobiales bacterium]
MKAVELCAGAGGQALGVEMAGFKHSVLVEIDSDCCRTLSANRPQWDVREQDLRDFSGIDFRDIDLLAGGLPCPPFSIAGKQLGEADERNMFPEGIRLVSEINPKAVMFENVRGMLSSSFDEYRTTISDSIEAMGYRTGWRLLNSSDFGVPQNRSRVVFMAIKRELCESLPWPPPSLSPPPTVAETLKDLLAANGWEGVEEWCKKAESVAPTIVGGSKKHGGPDLGPTRAKEAWRKLGVNGKSIAELPPECDFTGMPRLTVPMVARIQGFPDSWKFEGRKTSAYRQVGNAFPPPVATAVAKEIAGVLECNRLLLQPA